MGWRLILEVVSSLNDEVRMRYSNVLRREKHLDVLLELLFHVLPDSEELKFTSNLPDRASLKRLCCSIYYQLLCFMPALIRNWWSLQPQKVSGEVKKFTVNHVTPVLWDEEVERVQAGRSFGNMTVRVRPQVREVVANYRLESEEGNMELVIMIPLDFPLGTDQG